MNAVLPAPVLPADPTSWRLQVGDVIIRVHRRRALVVAVLLILTAALAAWSLTLGDVRLGVDQVLAALSGRAGRGISMLVLEWRLPRTLLAVTLGAALGMGGAVFQSLTRNPLGSPDIIGFDAGAYTGAVLVIVSTGGSYVSAAGGALAGGLATAALVYLLAYRRGTSGFRLIIVGIGLTALYTSLTSWLLLTTDPEVARSAAVWGAGSLNGTSWEQTGPAMILVALTAAALALVAPALRQLELGDDLSRASGVAVPRTRLVVLALGVVLSATSVAAAGPIAFIALASPQVALRLVRSTRLSLAASAATGAFLLLVADLVAQHALSFQLPVGTVTVCLGGSYLIWLLIREARSRS